jgi:alkyl hydroperoxide reductase subunit AhpC
MRILEILIILILPVVAEKLGVEIKFPLIADDLGKVASRMGMIHPGKGTNTVRAVFIIDPQGVVRLILFYPQEVGPKHGRDSAGGEGTTGFRCK